MMKGNAEKERKLAKKVRKERERQEQESHATALSSTPIKTEPKSDIQAGNL